MKINQKILAFLVGMASFTNVAAAQTEATANQQLNVNIPSVSVLNVTGSPSFAIGTLSPGSWFTSYNSAEKYRGDAVSGPVQIQVSTNSNTVKVVKARVSQNYSSLTDQKMILRVTPHPAGTFMANAIFSYASDEVTKSVTAGVEYSAVTDADGVILNNIKSTAFSTNIAYVLQLSDSNIAIPAAGFSQGLVITYSLTDLS